jgi:hypothetical protein
LHRKLAPDSPVNEKLADVEFVGFAGDDVIAGAAGAVRSTVHVKDVAELVFPPAVAVTWNVCDPAARPE